jgi:RNA polymerase-binding transcription factor DksA
MTNNIDNTTTKLRYSKEDLKEFEDLLVQKLAKSKQELSLLKEAIASASSESGSQEGSMLTVEDGAVAFEKEHLNQLAARTLKYILQLEHALFRIKNGTYGVCVDTGKLISKERLRAVPHTMHSVEAKIAKR